MADFATLDDFDRAILEVVQRDSSLTQELIGEKVNLSASSVRRRLADLRAGGFILREVALLNRARLGVVLIVSITLNEETPEAYSSLDRLFESEEPVKQSYHVAGNDDYVIIVHSASVSDYEAWSRSTLMTNGHIKRFNTRVAMSQQKFDTSIAIG